METSGNSDHEAAILQFQEICGTQDDGVCRMFLERFNWNLELAVQEYLNVGDGLGSFQSDSNNSTENFNESESSLRYRGHDPGTSRAGIVPQVPLAVSHGYQYRASSRRLGWIEWGLSLIALPFRFFQRTLWDIAQFLYRLLFPAFRAITDPVADVNTFIRRFEDKYGVNHPQFFSGSYSMALNEAKRELKTLLIYLHSDSHRDSDKFCRQTLSAPSLRDFINTNCLFWACNVNSGEGYRVSNAMRQYSYPFLAMVCLRDNRMMLVFRREGFCSADELLDILVAVVQDNEAHLSNLREERQQQQLNTLLRQQQEEAFQASLLADREREAARRNEERMRIEAAETREKQEEEQRSKQKVREQLRQQIRDSFPEEPPHSDDTIRVSLKFPCGFRIERRFLSSDSLELLYKFAFCQNECPQQFSIVTNFPRTVLFSSGEITSSTFPGQTGDKLTFSAASLSKAVMLFVIDTEA